MLCLITGAASSIYTAASIDDDLHHLLWPIHNGMLAYTGFGFPPICCMDAGAAQRGRM